MDVTAQKKLEEEILPFLNPSAREDVLSIAVEYFLGLTGSEEGKKFIGNSPKFLEAITSLTPDKHKDKVIVRQALIALINLATEEEISWSLLNQKCCPSFGLDLISAAIDPTNELADIVCRLICNLTRSQRCAVKMADFLLGEKAGSGPNLHLVVTAMCNLKHNKSEKVNLHYLGPFLSNLSQVPAVRRELMDREKCVIQQLTPWTEFQASLIRRGGAVGAIKNCCFDSEHHSWLLGEQVDILPHLLLPLAGPEEFDEDDMERLPPDLQYLAPDKQREEDPDIRKMLIEALTQLCATKEGRSYLREKNTYIIMRELHKWEPDRRNSVAIHSLIDILIADEPSEEMADLHKVEVPQKVQEQLEKDAAQTEQEIMEAERMEQEQEMETKKQ